MAKQLVNPVERHVEKAVLGLAVLLLIGVVVKYLVASPNQIEMRGEFVSPNTIDAKLRQKAADVRERVRRAPVDDARLDPLYGDFEAIIDPFKAEGLLKRLPLTGAIGPEVPLVDPFGGVVGKAALVEPVPLAEPAHVVVGRSTYLLYDRGVELRPWANWVTVSAVFDVKRMMELQAKEFGRTLSEVIFGPVELERRARRSDGSWSDDDWTLVKPWPGMEMPQIPTITLFEEDGRLVVPADLAAPLAQFFEEFGDKPMQLDLIRPLMPDIVNGTEWTVPIITSLRDVLEQDDYLRFYNEPPAADPDNRYKPRAVRAVSEQVADVSPAALIAQRFSEAERLLASAEKNDNVNDARRAWNLAQEVALNKDASAGDKSRAQRFKDEADRVEADIRRKIWVGGSVGRVADSESEEEPLREPPLIQQVWAHDCAPGSIESGRIYQYRMRVNILNQLAGEPDKLENKEEATVVFVTGDWTEPIEVAIEPSTYFFATGQDPRKQEVSVEFFQWFEGNWIKTRDKFSVGDQDELQEIVEVPSPGGGSTERTTVDFKAGATVVDIDFERVFRERKKGDGRSGVRFAPGAKVCCAVFADAAGRLQERCVPTDKAHPDKRMVQDRVWRP